MLFEVLSTLSMLGVLGASSYFKQNGTGSDADKIVKIANNCGLKTNDESIRIYRRRKRDNYTEYIFKIPLGLEEKDFQEKIGKFRDGLNNKSVKRISLEDFKNIDFKNDPIKQIQDIFNKREKINKEVEFEYDGMLKVRVYNEGLGEDYPIDLETIKRSPWKVPLGRTYKDEIVHDFEKYPHILIGGATDTGKSSLLNVIINSLIYNAKDDVEFTLLDLKGGLEFSAYKNLKQTKYFATDEITSYTVLNEVLNHMNRLFDRLSESGKRNVKQLGIKKRHFLIIDEAAELASHNETDPEIKKIKIACERLIASIARRGRACGIRVIYSTQYPTAETVTSQTKRNLFTRICLPVDTSTASKVILDQKGGESLPYIKGRAIYKIRDMKIMQSYYIKDNLIEEIIKPYKRQVTKNSSHEGKAKAARTSNLAIFEKV